MARKKPHNTDFDPIRSLGKVASFISFGIFVIIVINYVDARYRYQKELLTQEDLIAQDNEQRARLEKYKGKAERMKSAIAKLEDRAVTESELAKIQDELLSLAKQYNCTLKKASPRGTIVRAFEVSKKTFDMPPLNGSLPVAGGQDKEFDVHEIGLALSFEGELKATMEFLDAIKKQPWFISTYQLGLRRDLNNASRLATELELRFSSLHRCQELSNTVIPSLPRT